MAGNDRAERDLRGVIAYRRSRPPERDYPADFYHRDAADMFALMDALGHSIDGVAGSTFAVWAPNAQRVSVVGSFNDWNIHAHAMERRGSTGVWERFVPDVGHGLYYKFAI